MSKKLLIISIFLLLILFLAGNASSEVEPVYAGWTVGDSWDDGSGTSYGTILRSTDSGETWIRQGADQIADVGMGGVFAVDPYTAWVVGESDSGYATIYHTTDGGSTWERKGSADPASADYVPDVSLLKVHAVGNDVWAVGAGTILHTSDGGATWTNHIPVVYENPHDNLLQGVYVVDSNTAWVTGRHIDYGNNNSEIDTSMILKTTDSGLTWTRQSYVFDEDPTRALGISAADADTAWAVGGSSTMLKTTNGGATWAKESNPLSGAPFDLNEVYAVSTSTVWVAGDFDIYWTHDGGKSWGKAGFTGSKAYMGISAVSAQKAWGSYNCYSNEGHIAYTTDGGTTWTKVEKLCDECGNLPSLMNISFATQPITGYLINSLIEDVEQLVDDDFLNQGQGNALIVKLEQVMDCLVNDRLKPAINTLDAFLNQVDAFDRGGVLPPETGQDLYNQVNYIIELLSFPL